LKGAKNESWNQKNYFAFFDWFSFSNGSSSGVFS